MVGQHIRALKGGRWIHAIDCGDETVLHLVSEAAPQRVRRAYRPEFAAGSTAVEVVTHRERTFPSKEIVRRAYSRASDPSLAAMFPDSEAFAEWCATGRLFGARSVVEVPALPAAAPAAKAPAAKPAPRKKAAAKRAAPARKAKKVATKRAPKKAKSKARRGKPSRGGVGKGAKAPRRSKR